MSLLTTHTFGHRTLMKEDGFINAPFSIYLDERFDNPNTREVVAGALRVLHRFLEVFEIDLPARALEGECLRTVECRWLAELVYRPLAEIEKMSAKMIKRVLTARREDEETPIPADAKGAVEPNTAAKRLNTVADFLEWYRRNLLNEAIRSASARQELEKRYSEICAGLDGKIGGTKQGHHHQIRSLPAARYLQIITELFVNPERMFTTPMGKDSPTLKRDRAMVLLAAEGLRPGALGNLTIDDFRYRAGDAKGYVVLKDNVPRRKAPLTTATPTVKGIRSTSQKYNSNITVRLWPFTCLAIQDYIDSERAEVLSRRLTNRSKSFLFLAEHGGPFEDRTSITHVFRRLGEALKILNLLDTVKGDPFNKRVYYQFSAYTLRHSAASFFYLEKKHKPDVKDLMRHRFGWSEKSTQPDRYANRAMSEAASVNMMEFYESLLQAVAAKKRSGAQPNRGE